MTTYECMIYEKQSGSAENTERLISRGDFNASEKLKLSWLVCNIFFQVSNMLAWYMGTYHIHMTAVARGDLKRISNAISISK